MKNNIIPAITKVQFIKCIESIQKYLEECHSAGQALDTFCEGAPIILIGDDLCNTMIHLLEDAMGDEAETISWWFFEAPNDYKKIWLTLPDGSEQTWDLSTIDALFDYLTENFRKEDF